jgi:transposase
MPVANEIIKSRDEQNADWDLTDLNYALCTTNIEYVYKAVVEFIKEYNRTTDYNKVTYYD